MYKLKTNNATFGSLLMFLLQSGLNLGFVCKAQTFTLFTAQFSHFLSNLPTSQNRRVKQKGKE